MKNTHCSQKTFELEKKMIKTDQWHTAHPEAYRIAKESSDEGYPTGIAYDEELGWCVLMSGQGPFIAWCEKDYNIDLDRSLTSTDIGPNEGLGDFDV